MARWPHLSFRTKLLATYLALAAVVGGGLLYAVDRKLGADLVSALDQRLEAQARAVSGWLARSGNPPRLARRLSNVVDARVSILDSLGMVQGDSEIDPERLGLDPEGDSHAVDQARAGRIGREIRYSPLAGRDMYYLAVPSKGGRVIRLAVPIADIQATRRGLRDRLLVLSLMGFAAALVLALFAVRAVARPLQIMTGQARRLAEGRYEAAPPLTTRDELGVLSRALASLASQVRDRIDDLERERDLLSTVIGSLVEGVAVVDPQRTVVLLNASARAILERDRGDELVDPDLCDLIARAESDGRLVDRELDLRGRSLVASVQPLAHAGAAAVLVLYDVTRLRRLETVRRDFVANLTHELRTPVTAIRGYAETLVSTGVDETTRAEFLQTIQRNAVRIGRLVDDLLVLQDLDARPRDRLASDPVELAAVVGHVQRTMQPHAERTGVTLDVDVGPGLKVLADADGLEHVVQNLVDNAIKYGGGTSHTVRVTAARRERRIELSVADDGPGIAPAQQERIFERFYRVDPGRARDQGGTGLGLSIVKNLTESMGGTVALESQPGAGCRFVVSLRAHGEESA